MFARRNFKPVASICTTSVRFMRKRQNPRHKWWERYNVPVIDPQALRHDYYDKRAAEVPLGTDYIDKLGQIWLDREVHTKFTNQLRDDYLVKHKNHWLPEVDVTQPRLAFSNVEGLKSAPESVKRIFSVEFGKRKDLTDVWKKEFLEHLQHDKLDESSLEAKIAYHTFRIRASIKLYDDNRRSRYALDYSRRYRISPRDPIFRLPLGRLVWLKNLIVRLLDQRRRLLGLLRDTNRESFENVLRTLRIAYRIPPLFEDIPVQSRKGWVEHQVRVRARNIVQDKLDAYHKEIMTGREEFLARKAKLLPELAAEEVQLKKELDTVTTEDGEKLNVVGAYNGHTIDCFQETLDTYDFYQPRVKDESEKAREMVAKYAPKKKDSKKKKR